MEEVAEVEKAAVEVEVAVESDEMIRVVVEVTVEVEGEVKLEICRLWRLRRRRRLKRSSWKGVRRGQGGRC